ncbi:MAG: hypothetical protein M1167_03445, partial [Chloroflexi bacterium]|nr:hypothetical protein [Chloroflexota bacterium]
MKNKIALVSIVTVLSIVFLSLSSIVVSAQYQTQQSVNVTVSSAGVAHVEQSSTVGSISIDIAGTPGATGSVSTAVYAANPQPDAGIPNNVVL